MERRVTGWVTICVWIVPNCFELVDTIYNLQTRCSSIPYLSPYFLDLVKFQFIEGDDKIMFALDSPSDFRGS